MNKHILFRCAATAVFFLIMTVNSQAEPQDVPDGTERERAALLTEQSILELELDVAKKKEELAKHKVGSAATDGIGDAPISSVNKLSLIGVRGQSNHLTAVLRVGRMPLSLKVGEQFDDYKLIGLTPLCATFERAGAKFKRCLSSTSDTSPPIARDNQLPGAAGGGGFPVPAPAQGAPNQLPGGN